jgi:hypothetical protein
MRPGQGPDKTFVRELQAPDEIVNYILREILRLYVKLLGGTRPPKEPKQRVLILLSRSLET